LKNRLKEVTLYDFKNNYTTKILNAFIDSKTMKTMYMNPQFNINKYLPDILKKRKIRSKVEDKIVKFSGKKIITPVFNQTVW